MKKLTPTQQRIVDRMREGDVLECRSSSPVKAGFFIAGKLVDTDDCLALKYAGIIKETGWHAVYIHKLIPEYTLKGES